MLAITLVRWLIGSHLAEDGLFEEEKRRMTNLTS
jgi:hypothetical protein